MNPVEEVRESCPMRTKTSEKISWPGPKGRKYVNILTNGANFLPDRFVCP